MSNKKTYFVYILLCADGSYYTGMTSNIEKRLAEHQSKKDPSSYTARRLPVSLEFFCEFSDPYVAMNTERQIKKWSKQKKVALIENRFEDLPNLAKKNF
ncbi:MAG: GIY-YIG nuclease family protein [Crocinitomicaceae bacterium]|nr:GIY-YIG nuclease family protein [Crocinitomicaceae bacterium]